MDAGGGLKTCPGTCILRAERHTRPNIRGKAMKIRYEQLTPPEAVDPDCIFPLLAAE